MIRKFVNEIISSMDLGEWTGFYKDRIKTTHSPEFVLMKGGLVFDGYEFFLMGRKLDINLTPIEKEVLLCTCRKKEERYILDNPTEDTLELAFRFGGISGSN